MAIVNEHLAQLGLSENEIAVYLALLKKSRLSPAELSKSVNMNRTTVYSVAKELVKKGLAEEDLGSTSKYLSATDSNSLIDLIEKEEKAVLRKKETARKVVKELSALPFKIGPSIPRIRFIEENKVEKFLYEQTDKWNESIKKFDGLWWGFQDKKFAEASN